MNLPVARPGNGQPRRAGPAQQRARRARVARRATQARGFRRSHVNLVPLVGAFMSIVIFSLSTTTISEVVPPAARGVVPARASLPVPTPLTLRIGRELSVDGRPLTPTVHAADSRSLAAPEREAIRVLYMTLRLKADSIRGARGLPANGAIDAPIAIHAAASTRYELLDRVMHTARLAGFRSLTLQVDSVKDAVPAHPATNRGGPRTT